MAYVRQCCCSFGREFKEFTLRGNIFDLAIGIIIGTAFQNVVKSLVDDIITPPFGLIFDGVDFSNLTIRMTNFIRKGQPPVVIRYGLFLQQIIHLLVMALALFWLLKCLNRLNRISLRDRQLAIDNQSLESNPIEEPCPIQQVSVPNEQLKVLCEIRDLLAAHNHSATSRLEQPSNLISL